MTPPEHLTSLLHARLGGAMIGLPSMAVREIVRAVAITPLPGAPAVIEGAVNVRGEIVPVLNVRERLGLPSKRLDPDEFLILLHAGERLIAMRVDDVDELVEVTAAGVSAPAALSPALRGMSGLAAREDGVLVIYDPGSFLTQAEDDAIDLLLSPER